MKTVFEQMGGTYASQGDYLIPDFKLSEKEQREIGVWGGQRHKHYLKQYHRVRYYNLQISGKFNEYLADVNEQAVDMFLQLVKELADKEGVTEKVKAENAMLWTQRVNNICNRAMEIVNSKVIFVR